MLYRIFTEEKYEAPKDKAEQGRSVTFHTCLSWAPGSHLTQTGGPLVQSRKALPLLETSRQVIKANFQHSSYLSQNTILNAVQLFTHETSQESQENAQIAKPWGPFRQSGCCHWGGSHRFGFSASLQSCWKAVSPSHYHASDFFPFGFKFRKVDISKVSV